MRMRQLSSACGIVLGLWCRAVSAGDLQVQAFLANHTDARLLPSPGHLLPGMAPNGTSVPDNGAGEHDGFFYALLHKSAAA